MGNASSVPPAVEFLESIAGGQPIFLSDPKWKQLLAFPTSLASYDPTDIQGHIRPHTASLGKLPSLTFFEIPALLYFSYKLLSLLAYISSKRSPLLSYLQYTTIHRPSIARDSYICCASTSPKLPPTPPASPPPTLSMS
jgi:hypothetical protein